MNKLNRLAMLATVTLLSLPVAAASAQPPPPPVPPGEPVQPLEYAVKFVCGRPVAAQAASQAAAGNYYTMINVHNPGRLLELSHKVAVSGIGRAGRMTDFQTDVTLRYDEAAEFDCRWIAARLFAAGVPTPGLFTGFVVLQTRRELDVVAVYTAAPTNTNQVATMHTERVPVRRVIP